MIVSEFDIPEHAISEVRAMHARGESTEALIAAMRTLGLEKVASIRVLADVCGLSLGRSKELVHFSPTWADRLDSDQRFQDSLYRNAERAGILAPDHEQELLKPLKTGTHGR